MTMFRVGFSVTLAGVFLVCSSGVVRAQAAGGPAATPLPLAVDLKKVPVGSWSEYRIADGQNTMSVRMALVAKGSQSAQMETQIKGGPMAALGQTTVRMSVPLDDSAEVKPKDQVIQLGDNPPMLLPVEMSGGQTQSFKKLDPKKRIGVDSVTVPAGTFAKAEHYRDKGASGETIDFWISKTVLPFGLIKVTSSGAPGGKAVEMELTGQGAGAKAAITKTPLPFDAATIMKQAQPALGGNPHGGGASPHGGAPPMRPIPSPHPGMPGTTPTPPGGPGSQGNSGMMSPRPSTAAPAAKENKK